jgi:hypothetical protein
MGTAPDGAVWDYVSVPLGPWALSQKRKSFTVLH